MSDTERALVDEIDKRKRLAKRLEEYEQPDDALLRIGAPAIPFLEQVEWMRKRLAVLEEAARDVVESFVSPCGNPECKACTARKRLGEVLAKGN